MILAQIPSISASTLGTVLVALFALLLCADIIVRLFVRKPPLEAEFMTITRCGALHAALGTEIQRMKERMDSQNEFLQEKLDQLKTDLNTSGERRASAIHERINQLASAVARLDERTNRNDRRAQ